MPTSRTLGRKERCIFNYRQMSLRSFNRPSEIPQCDHADDRSSPNDIPQYSVRLFCTSNDHYRQPGAYTSNTAHITNKKIPIEYPNTPDFVMDDYHLRYTERGLRGKPGSAPPVDLHRTSRGISLVPGTLRSVVFGHTGPTTGKKKDVAKVSSVMAQAHYSAFSSRLHFASGSPKTNS